MAQATSLGWRDGSKFPRDSWRRTRVSSQLEGVSSSWKNTMKPGQSKEKPGEKEGDLGGFEGHARLHPTLGRASWPAYQEPENATYCLSASFLQTRNAHPLLIQHACRLNINSDISASN
ncbi:hypothetical protein CDL15_Pgr013863 [Punica granatum]|uniref:Uncharacterized protein n=1 Tax=Punica granatum TaxID=22663 RepID=A0A218WJ18_PUNGR|nr:hypothetical protein CDL15_Pgr013863 [Punica granatum]